jgi:tryptophanyl-tRNA synthetase
MNLEIILTGDRPTGKLHLGHYFGSLENRIELQNNLKYNQYVMVADWQALTDNADNPTKVTNNIIEVVLDYLAVGICPQKTTIFLQSQIPEIAELTQYYLNLVSLGRLKRNPTIKNEMQQKNYGNNVPVGFLTYPISQAADITIFKANLVPAGADQIPIIEQTNEIIRKFNMIYQNIIPEVKILLSPQKRLCGIDGKTKMSKSLNNAIYLSDNNDIIKQKVMQMYTDSNHININDPGQIKGNTVFTFLDLFKEEQEKVLILKEQYQKGGLGDVFIKKYLLELLIALLEPIRTKREDLSKNLDYIKNILKTGSNKARSVAINNIKEIRNTIGIMQF